GRHASDQTTDHRLFDGVARMEHELPGPQRGKEPRHREPGSAEPVGAEHHAAGLPERQQDEQDDQPIERNAPVHVWILGPCYATANKSSTRGALAMMPCSSR